MTEMPAHGAARPTVTLQPDPSPDVMPFYRDWTKGDEPRLARQELIRRVRALVKYVFVILNENESFDHYFGTFPGANGIYSDGQHPREPKDTPGFTQSYKDFASGERVTVEPFLIGPDQNANVLDSLDHSHVGLARKLHVSGGIAAMDQFALDEYSRYAVKGVAANEAKGTQFARLVMSHIDCDTIPFLWQYASRFVLFDNIFATENGPSTPNAIALIAGQSGETQWVQTSADRRSYLVRDQPGLVQPPLVTDPPPFYGSQFDATAANRELAAPREHYETNDIAANLTFALVLLTLLRGDAKAMTGQDLNPSLDLRDIKKDIAFLSARKGKPVAWRWYQEGYDREPVDTGSAASHEGYVGHHEAPQYFGYVANNPALRKNLRGLQDFFTDLAAAACRRTAAFFTSAAAP